MGKWPAIPVVTALGCWAVLACGDVEPKEGQYECSVDGDCPSGWICNTAGDGLCYEEESHFPSATESDSGLPTTSDVSSTGTGSSPGTGLDSGSHSQTDIVDTNNDTGPACKFTGVAVDFETGDGGFTHASTIVDGPDPWELSNWGGTCASGTSCFITAPGATYARCTSAELVSPTLDLSGCATSTMTLRFFHRYSFEPLRGGQYRDGGLVQVSGDDGSTWLDVAVSPAYTGLLVGDYSKACGGVPAAADGHEAWSAGPSSGWLEVSATVPVAAITGAFRLRFLFGSDRVGELLGWAVDDVSLSLE